MSRTDLLNKAFETFNNTSIKLTDSYQALQCKVNRLNKELEEKNQILKNNAKKLKRLEAQALRRDRLAAMGEMAAKVAHEIRNPLGSIQLFASILKKEFIDDSPNLSIVNHIYEGVKNLDNVISNLLLFTKSPRANCQLFDVEEFLLELLDFTKNVISEHGIVINRKFQKRVKRIYGDKELLKQVFLNLILNAIQSMPDGGILTLSTERKNGTGKKSEKAGAGTAIYISDTGIGIKKDEKNKVFDPFYTTKDRGTGLGLTIVHNIVLSHGGFIEIEDNNQQGTIFTVVIPDPV